MGYKSLSRDLSRGGDGWNSGYRNTGIQLVCHVDFELLARFCQILNFRWNLVSGVEMKILHGGKLSLPRLRPNPLAACAQILRETQINLAQNKYRVRPKWRACSQAKWAIDPWPFWATGLIVLVSPNLSDRKGNNKVNKCKVKKCLLGKKTKEKPANFATRWLLLLIVP